MVVLYETLLLNYIEILPRIHQLYVLIYIYSFLVPQWLEELIKHGNLYSVIRVLLHVVPLLVGVWKSVPI